MDGFDVGVEPSAVDAEPCVADVEPGVFDVESGVVDVEPSEPSVVDVEPSIVDIEIGVIDEPGVVDVLSVVAVGLVPGSILEDWTSLVDSSVVFNFWTISPLQHSKHK